MAHPVSARLSTAYTASAGRKFGFTVGGALAVLGAISLWRGHQIPPKVLLSLAGLLLASALVIPTKLEVVERGWMKFAHALSKVTTPIFMGVVYFVVLTPLSFLRRAFGGSALVHTAGPTGLWADRSDKPRSSLDRLF